MGPRIAVITDPPLDSAVPAHSPLSGPLIAPQATISQWIMGASRSLICVKVKNLVL
jgi:hypothetical protein